MIEIYCGAPFGWLEARKVGEMLQVPMGKAIVVAAAKGMRVREIGVDRPYMAIRKWEGGWRWTGHWVGKSYDLGWVETMTPVEAWREMLGMMGPAGRKRVSDLGGMGLKRGSEI